VLQGCAGDVPYTEAVSAAWLLQKFLPGIRVRLVNVVDLGILIAPEDRPHAMDHVTNEALFTRDAPVMFDFHESTWLIH
ncbi:phosphoketolase family protein, partial [Pseudomonas syringae group genomosp. 7]|uniref:phosphoketolase family protein n=1 Tax=Pseudomonas syringae group genomosp. 7 TaxID=251699 RepID=UPI00376F7D66